MGKLHAGAAFGFFPAIPPPAYRLAAQQHLYAGRTPAGPARARFLPRFPTCFARHYYHCAAKAGTWATTLGTWQNNVLFGDYNVPARLAGHALTYRFLFSAHCLPASLRLFWRCLRWLPRSDITRGAFLALLYGASLLQALALAVCGRGRTTSSLFTRARHLTHTTPQSGVPFTGTYCWHFTPTPPRAY